MVTPLSNPKHMVLSLTEKGARFFFTRFLRNFISTGCVTILEEGGSVYTFAGKNSRCHLKSVLVIHSPQFYWKVMTQADLGLADAYINGDFSFVDKERGLLDLLMILIANKELNSNNSNHAKRRGWWTPMFLTASLASAKHFLKHASRQNTLTQARRNISRHYDLSNELFALFLDDTMTYSSAVFKSNDEDLRTAQMRKISLLIDKTAFLYCSVENVENIGIHYYQTLRCWRKTFLERQKQIIDLGFDDKFIRTWEYYFDYCAAGFKTLTLGNYQVVFSRPGNVAALGDPFHCFPSAQS
ncbi:tuberculostearic acid methyltransferase UfaA1 [Brassica napus]|uniref:tuberculostearic acid methyltransferase UfaA1 n=1 Tax=Brassica napus TaxID=3708 RepID=UPI000BBF0EE4|nr:tuberculostearic acid methyltransferase UfaA1 [Brassica napus]